MSIKKITNNIKCISTNQSYLMEVDDRWSMRVAEEGQVIGPSICPMGEVRRASVEIFCDYKIGFGDQDSRMRDEALRRVSRDLITTLYIDMIKELDRTIEDICCGNKNGAISRIESLRKDILG